MIEVYDVKKVKLKYWWVFAAASVCVLGSHPVLCDLAKLHPIDRQPIQPIRWPRVQIGSNRVTWLARLVNIQEILVCKVTLNCTASKESVCILEKKWVPLCFGSLATVTGHCNLLLCSNKCFCSPDVPPTVEQIHDSFGPTLPGREAPSLSWFDSYLVAILKCIPV